jgi:hypothetical protein
MISIYSVNSFTNDYSLLGCGAMWSGRFQVTLKRNLHPPSSSYKNKPRVEKLYTGIGRVNQGYNLVSKLI